MTFTFKRIFLAAAAVIISVGLTDAQPNIGWRGPERSGVYNETGLLKTWPSAGPSLIWEYNEAGAGYSSTTVTDDAVYITGRKGDNDVLTALAPDGKKKWELVYGKASKSNYPDSRGTPTYYNGKLYLVSGHGDMVCVDRNGKIVWSVNYFDKYNAPHPRFGIAESPVVLNNMVIGTPGGKMAAMVAFNPDNGRIIWETPPVDELTQYVSPLLIENDGKKIVVTLTTAHVLGIDPSTGRLLWKYHYEGANAQQGGRRNHTNTPIYRDGSLLVANGYTQVAVKLKINWDGTPPTLVWKNTDLTPHVGGLVLLGNNIFSSTHDNNSKGRWICVDWNTGNTLWITDWHNKGSVISSDGMLYIYEEKDGHVGLVRPSAEKLDVVSSFRIAKGSGPHWAHPVIDKGRLFVRHGDHLAVYSLRPK